MIAVVLHMHFRILYLLLVIFPLFAQSQNVGSWTMYVDRTAIAFDATGKAQTVSVKHIAKGKIQFRFAPIDTSIMRSIIVMNDKRSGIDSKQLPHHCVKIAFSVKDLYNKSNGQSVSFYTADKPADPAKAVLVRIAPVLFCTITWTE